MLPGIGNVQRSFSRRVPMASAVIVTPVLAAAQKSAVGGHRYCSNMFFSIPGMHLFFVGQPVWKRWL